MSTGSPLTWTRRLDSGKNIASPAADRALHPAPEIEANLQGLAATPLNPDHSDINEGSTFGALRWRWPIVVLREEGEGAYIVAPDIPLLRKH